jgi:hypothetical protein
LVSSGGLALAGSFLKIRDAKIRRSIVAMVEELANDEAADHLINVVRPYTKKKRR